MNVNEKVIKLAWNLKVSEKNHMPEKIQMSKLMEDWTSKQEVAKGKNYVLGSSEEVYKTGNKGLFETICLAYNRHLILKTCPEDWWLTISQKIAVAIDTNGEHPDVRKFFVSHEGKKILNVGVGPSIYGVDYDWFFKAMTNQIEKNINNPDYAKIMDHDFSTSTPVQKTVNNIMLMYSFQKYFEYRMMLLCGIPGVIMTGLEDDWKQLIEKHKKVEEFLKPLDHVLNLGNWFKTSRKVLEKLLETFQGKPDEDWWSRIITRRSFGSGGQSTYDGWLIREFFGSSYDGIPSGVNVVPLTITNGVQEDEASVVDEI